MAHDVFISHSVKDKTTADAMCATLESEGVRCWIAPRDVTPGMEWGKCIIDAIREARIMVLVFTAHANASQQIRREIERAVHHDVIIVPFRVEDVVPDESLEYFIGNVHWLDALTPPLEAHLESLAATVKLLLGRMHPREELREQPEVREVPAQAPSPPEQPMPRPRAEAPQPVQPFAGMPAQYAPPDAPIPFIAGASASAPTVSPSRMPFLTPGQVPMSVDVAPPAPAMKSRLWWLVILVVAAGVYLYYTRTQAQQGTTPAQQTQPGGSGGNQDQAVIAAQQFTGGFNYVNGQIQLTNGRWVNGSNIPLAAATLGCGQLDANGQNLEQDQVMLNGPAQPGQTVTLPTFMIGAMVQGATEVRCKITAVEPAN
jgi:hypothetical protein